MMRRMCWGATLGVLLCAMPASGQYEGGGATKPPTPPVNTVKRLLKDGKVVIGITIATPSIDVAATLAESGFDFLWIETEHSPTDLESVHALIMATRGTRAMPFTRVPVNELWQAKRMLDSGSIGVVFPFTSTRALAEQAVKACRYPPQGLRGYGPALALLRWGMSGPDYAKWADENVMVIVIVEQKQAIDNIDEIASVPGIDVLFIGLNDLSYSLGVGGRLNDPLVVESVDKVLSAGKKYGVPVGTVSPNTDDINRRIAQGFRFFQASSDLALLNTGAREFLSRIVKR